MGPSTSFAIPAADLTLHPPLSDEVGIALWRFLGSLSMLGAVLVSFALVGALMMPVALLVAAGLSPALALAIDGGEARTPWVMVLAAAMVLATASITLG